MTVRVGVPRETKPGERRVGLDPAAASALSRAGLEVRVESNAGLGIGAADADYARAGARIVDRGGAWSSELVVKVKELQPGECAGIPRGTAIFSFHHLVGAPGAVRALAGAGLTAIAFEMVRDAAGGFPILAPMSRLAGRIAIEKARGYRPDARRVLVLGAGHVGREAAHAALSAGLAVAVLCRRDATRAALAEAFGERVAAGLATPEAVERAAMEADIVVGAVFDAGAPTPKLISRALLRRMKPGTVLVDVCIEEGGIAETSRPTTHAEPVFVEENVLHYAVGNMPAIVPGEASRALAAAALPYVERMAKHGTGRAIAQDTGLRAGVLLWEGRVTNAILARESGLPLEALA